MMKRFLVVPLLLLFPLLSRAQNIIAQRPIGQQAVTFSATPTFDASKSNSFKIILTGNVTSSTVTGMEAGQELVFEVCQDAVGARTFAWPGLMVGPIAILSGANVCTVETFHYDGTSATIWTTTTAGGGGSGTVNSGTGKCITWYASTGTTVSNDCNLDDGLTNANGLTYSPANGIYATQYNSTASGAFDLIGTEGTVSGAATGKDVLACGDSTSHSCQISNNGDSFRSILTSVSTSPVQHGVNVAGTQFPQVNTVPRGSAGQPFLESTSTADPGFGQLDLSVAANVVNRLAKANQTASTVYNDQVNTFTTAGTLDLSASTVASAMRLPNGSGLTTAVNGALGYDTTSNNIHAGVNGADSRVPIWTGTAPVHHNCAWWTNVSGHIELGDSGSLTCGGGSSPRLDQVTSATAGWTTTNADNPLLTQFAATTAGRIAWRVSESSAGTSTGTAFLHQIDTLAGSTLNPLQVCAGGTSNCWRWDTSSLFKPIGTAALAIPGTAHGTVISQAGSAATTTVSPGTAGQVLISNGSSTDPSFQDPIISQAYVNLWTAQDVTVTRTSSAIRNPVFSQTGTLQLTWASITGTPATCTLQIQGVDSQGNALNNGSTFAVTPANGTTSQTFSAAAALQSAAQIRAIFACVTYPTAGNLTLDFTPIPNVNVTNTVTAALSAGSALVGKVGIDQTTPGTTNAVSATNLPTTVDTNSGNKSASTLRVVLATDQPALTNKLLVTPDSVALPLHQSANVDQLNGTTTDTNSGTKSAGTLRVVLATDQPQLTNKLLVTPDANVKVNVVGNAGAALDAAGQNAASPANELLAGCQFNTTPTTITSGNMSPLQCGNGGKLLVTPDIPALPSTILAGQQAVTASAVALASNTLTKGICVQALSTNAISVFIGPSGVTTSTGIELPAKASYCIAVSNSNALYVIASTTGASVTWSGN